MNVEWQRGYYEHWRGACFLARSAHVSTTCTARAIIATCSGYVRELRISLTEHTVHSIGRRPNPTVAFGALCALAVCKRAKGSRDPTHLRDPTKFGTHCAPARNDDHPRTKTDSGNERPPTLNRTLNKSKSNSKYVQAKGVVIKPSGCQQR